MAYKVFEMMVVRSGHQGKVALSNSFVRERHPESGKKMEIFVCDGGILLREDGVQIRRQDGKPTLLPRKIANPIVVRSGDDLSAIPERHNLPDTFKWKYQSVGRYCG